MSSLEFVLFSGRLLVINELISVDVSTYLEWCIIYTCVSLLFNVASDLVANRISRWATLPKIAALDICDVSLNYGIPLQTCHDFFRFLGWWEVIECEHHPVGIGVGYPTWLFQFLYQIFKVRYSALINKCKRYSHRCPVAEDICDISFVSKSIILYQNNDSICEKHANTKFPYLPLFVDASVFPGDSNSVMEAQV